MGVKGNVHIDIGALDLRGIDPAHRFRIAAAFEHELVRLLDHIPIAPRSGAAVVVPPLRFDPSVSPARVGQSVARAIVGALQGGKAR